MRNIVFLLFTLLLLASAAIAADVDSLHGGGVRLGLAGPFCLAGGCRTGYRKE